jgi:3,4-dihydroxy 2-butanone 4-phosphate synthase / GTP cyclohydrolase II
VTPFATIEEAIKDFQDGKFVIIVDDEDRENEGDLTMAAEKVTADAINFMAKEGRGLICTPVSGKRLDELEIPLMVDNNTSGNGTAFTVTVDARLGITTGISAADRAISMRALIDPETKPRDLVRPGHILPLRYAEGGVLRRAGHTEASVDLAKLAGMYPASVICEIISDDGTMSRLPQLEQFAEKYGIKMITIAALIEHRRHMEVLIRRTAQTMIPTEYGEFQLNVYESLVDDKHHLAFVLGDITGDPAPLVRVHSECLTGDVFGSQRCDCGPQLHQAMRMIQEEGRGVLVYMRQEGRGIGLVNKIRAYELQDKGMDTVEANEHLGFAPDPRDYGLGAQILRDIGVQKLRMMTNNPAKRVGIEAFGLEIVDRVPVKTEPTERNRKYLLTKQNKLGHILDME